MSAPSWMLRLAQQGRRLAALPAGRGGYGVFAGLDRRRRPLALASEREVAMALSAGLIEHAGPDWLVLTEAGQAHLRRAEAPAETAFACQHQLRGPRERMTPDGRIETLLVNLSESPLARYARPCGDRPALLEPDHFMAGERLRADYQRSAMGSPAASDWTRPPRGRSPSCGLDPAGAPAARLDARKRVMDALAAVGPGLDRLLMNVCLRETGMSRAEQALDWPARAGAPALRLALDRLAVHYGIRQKPKPVDPYV